MPSDPQYALSTLAKAIYELTVGPGPIKERLLDAYMVFHPVTEEDFPDDLAEDYRWLISQLSKFESPYRHKTDADQTLWDKGDVEHTLSKIRKNTAVEIAKRIVRLHSDLEARMLDS